MKLRKILLLITSVTLLSGCTIEYNLNISKEYLEENITLKSDEVSESVEISNYSLPTPAFVDSEIQSESSEKLEGVEYYNTDKSIGSNGYQNYNLKYKFNYDNYEKSNIVNNSVSIFNFYKKRDIYYIETGANIKVFGKNDKIKKLNVNVNLSNDLELVSSNADSVIGNTLIWNIERKDAKINPITIQYKKKEIYNHQTNNDNNINNPTNKTNENNTTSLIFALAGLLVFILILVIFISIKNRSRKFLD